MKLEIVKSVQGGDMCLLGGKVVAYREGSGKSEGKVVNVTLAGKVYNKETKSEEEKSIDIAFWNNDDGSRPLADRINKAKVGVGSIITVLAVKNKDDDSKAKALDFKYSGLWHFAEKGDQKELNVIIGTIASVTVDDQNRFVKVSVPVNVSKEETEWETITFWNNERAQMADRAKACLSPKSDGRKAKAAIVCGQNVPYNNKPSYTGFRFELFPY